MKEDQQNLPWTAQLLIILRAVAFCTVAAIVLFSIYGPARGRREAARAQEAVTAGAFSPGARMVVPVGRAVGIKLFSDGVMVVGLSEVAGTEGPSAPAKTCGLKQGDIITHINETQVDTIEEVQTILKDLEGAPMSIRAVRDEKQVQLTARAVKCAADGSYKLGAWIRDSMAGIGTVTFYDPATGQFGALGHGVNDVDTALLMPLESGSVMYATVADVKKGLAGQPGELHGTFRLEQDLGTLYANTDGGVFGVLTDDTMIQGVDPVPMATRGEVKVGPAVIRSNIAGDQVEEYTVEITKVYPSGNDTRDLMVKVTDPRLLEQTGGIVQGMSGSPILQNGMLIGAVTHVLINDPASGYGILAERMLAKADAPTNAKAS